MDIQVGLTSNNWEFMLNLDNAFDERYYTDVEPFPNFGFGGLNRHGACRNHHRDPWSSPPVHSECHLSILIQ
ncbi:MAG: hypothetical protein CM15mP84_05330 [Cellvibrionales bacterium]|nr:MAG: hypothetical protein CM15mP84_05330 [Cellvibrionales bacterium]